MERKLTLKAWRADANMTQADLAEAIGRSSRTIQSWEKGETSPTAADIAKIETALNIEWSRDVLVQ